MRRVDTSAWIECLIDPALGSELAAELPGGSKWLVPTIVQLELAKWLTRERGEDASERTIAFPVTCVVEDLNTRIALAAAGFTAPYGLPTADAIVYATARAHRAEVLTCDRHFQALPGVRYLAKAGTQDGGP